MLALRPQALPFPSGARVGGFGALLSGAGAGAWAPSHNRHGDSHNNVIDGVALSMPLKCLIIPSMVHVSVRSTAAAVSDPVSSPESATDVNNEAAVNAQSTNIVLLCSKHALKDATAIAAANAAVYAAYSAADDVQRLNFGTRLDFAALCGASQEAARELAPASVRVTPQSGLTVTRARPSAASVNNSSSSSTTTTTTNSVSGTDAISAYDIDAFCRTVPWAAVAVGADAESWVAALRGPVMLAGLALIYAVGMARWRAGKNRGGQRKR